MADDDIFLTTSAQADRNATPASIPKPVSPDPPLKVAQQYTLSRSRSPADLTVFCAQVYKKTYSWAHNSSDANWAAYITIAKAPCNRQSEEDMERGVGSTYETSRPVLSCP